jgi:hypothetical protein
MRTYRCWIGTLAVIASVGRLSLAAGAEPPDTRSAPPDTTPYVRPALPEELRHPGPPAPETPPTPPPPPARSKKSQRCHGVRHHHTPRKGE